MKTWMKVSLAASMIAAIGVASTTVMARGGDCGAYGERGGQAGWQQMAPEQMQARMQQRADLRFARLELALVLNDAQKPAWESFKASLTEQTAGMGPRMMQRQAAEDRPQTALERLERMEEMNTLREQHLSATRSAVETFYATLSDAQKTVFDSEFTMMGQDGPRGMGHKGGQMGQGRS